MLSVDLSRLAHAGREHVEAVVPPDAPVWEDLDFRFGAPVRLDLEAQSVGGGGDVLVRGTVRGVVAQQCRRCLEPLEVPLDVEVAMYFEAGVDETEAADEEVYALPERGGELDLAGPLRQELTLAVSPFPVCREDCRGLCPICGGNRNETECDCREAEVDERWAALRDINLD